MQKYYFSKTIFRINYEFFESKTITHKFQISKKRHLFITLGLRNELIETRYLRWLHLRKQNKTIRLKNQINFANCNKQLTVNANYSQNKYVHMYITWLKPASKSKPAAYEFRLCAICIENKCKDCRFWQAFKTTSFV